MKPVAVDPSATARAQAYALWMEAPNPMVTFFKTLNVSRLVRLSRRRGRKFNMLLCWCIGRAAAQVKEFYMLPVGRELLSYDALAARINAQLQTLRRERLRLQNGDAALKSAVANISHDLRTPLTAICGYLDLLSQEYASPQAARYLAVVRERAGAMRVLTQELFQYSVLSSAAEEMKRAPVCLNDILEQSLAGLYAELSAREIAPVIHFPERPIVRMLDADALRRIFDNILSNAVKYSGGDLDVALAADGTVEFTNSALGLTRVQAERLFDRFYTVQTGSSATGLGLSIARMLTEKMGGTISAQYQAGRLCICVRFSQAQTCRTAGPDDLCYPTSK